MFSKKEKLFFYVSVVILSFACCLTISMITGRGVFGSYTVLKGDGAAQFISFLAFFYDVVKGNTKDIMYSFSITPGGETSLLWGYYLVSPFNFIVLLFDKASLPDAYFWIECTKIIFAALSMGIFIVHYIERKKVHLSKENYFLMMVLTVAYSYCGFVAAYTHDIMWLDAVAVLPLLADGIFKILIEEKSVQYFISLTYAIVTNFYLGFALCIFSLLFFIYIVIVYRVKKKSVYFDYVLSSLLSAGASSILLIPTVKQVFSSKLADSSNVMFRLDRCLIELLLTVVIMIVVYAFYRLENIISSNEQIIRWKKYLIYSGIITTVMLSLHLILKKQAWKGNYIEKTVLLPFRFLIGVFDYNESRTSDLMCIYSGLLVIILLVLYFLDYRCDKRKKIISFEALTLCYFMMGFADVNYIWHGFTHPAGNCYRWSFVFSFFIIFLVIDYLIETSTFEKKLSLKKVLLSNVSFIITLLILLLLGKGIHIYRRLGYTFISNAVIGINVLFFFLYIAISFISKKVNAISILIPTVLVIEIIVNAVLYTVGFDYVSKDRYSRYIQVTSNIMDDIRKNGNIDIYRVECEYEPNWYYVAGYNSIFHYSSAFVRENHFFLDKFGMAGDYEIFAGEKAQNNFELSPELTGFLGIRYLITLSKKENKAYTFINSYNIGNESLYLYRNEYAFPLVFRCNQNKINVNYRDFDFSKIEESVRIYDDSSNSGLYETGYSTYACEITTQRDDAIVFSIPYIDGWKAYVDGQDAEIDKAYGYFISVNPEKGKHTVILKYRNPFIRISSIISLIALVIFLIKCCFFSVVIKKSSI